AQLRRALELREAVHGAESAYAADLLNDLAVLYRRQARYDEAMPLLERAVRNLDAAGKERRFDLAVAQNNIGHVHAGRGRAAEADAAFQRALAITEEAMGRSQRPENPGWFQRILRLKDCAASARSSGRAADAERLDARLRELVGSERKFIA